MAITLSKAESWDKIYQASKFINFASFDFAAVKQSLIEYFKLYHPEFNNWIETDEFVMQIEAFAYVCELYSYRLDMIANENLLSTAQRKDSILKLAKFISYNQSRNIAGTGLVKITSISTTEDVYDFNGNNLANKKVTWNDANNTNWKSQFFSIISAVISSDFGDVVPSNRVQIYDQIFELYTLKNIPLTNGIISYSAKIANNNVPMELVSAELSNAGPTEQRPKSDNKFNIIYGIDGLGDSSNFTGFFMLTKQGSLQKTQQSFDGVTTHISYTPAFNNVNNTDVWVNQLVNGSDVGAVEWTAVDTTNAQNIIFNSDYSKTKYEIETLDNDNIKILFGDGDFADIPSGLFDFWFRVSDPNPVPIPTSAINDLTTSIAYTGSDNNTYYTIINYSLVHPIQNAAPSEDKDHIKVNAPSVYYTQNRMVNGQDYNSYLLQDHSILKLSAINRTFAGHSKYSTFNDASGTYDIINHFGSDLSVYVNYDIATIKVSGSVSAISLIANYVQPLLSDEQNSYYRALTGIPARRLFSPIEKHYFVFDQLGEVYDITDTNPPSPKLPAMIYYNSGNQAYTSTALVSSTNTKLTSSDWLFTINKENGYWYVSYRTASVVAHSPTTKFWSNNAKDIINILDINPGSARTADNSPKQQHDIILPVIRNLTYSTTSNTGLPDFNSLIVTVEDKNNDGFPDVEEITTLITNSIVTNVANNKLYEDNKYTRLFNRVFNAPFDSYNVNNPTVQLDYDFLTTDVTITGDATAEYTIKSDGTRVNLISWAESGNPIANSVTITDPGANSIITISIADHVYLYRATMDDPFQPVTGNESVKAWLVEEIAKRHVHYIRKPGRSNLNFLWQHSPTADTRINPSTSNIIDCFIITNGYYESMLAWVQGNSSIKPVKPTPYELTNTYGKLIQNKMISDELVLSSGEFKIVFGKYAPPELQATIVVVKSDGSVLTDNQIKTQIVTEVYNYFDINYCNFGDTFNFTALSAHLHNQLMDNVTSIVIKPKNNQFGGLFQIHALENEIIIPAVTLDDIEIVSYLTSLNMGAITNNVSSINNDTAVNELADIVAKYEAHFTNTSAPQGNQPIQPRVRVSPPSPISLVNNFVASTHITMTDTSNVSPNVVESTSLVTPTVSSFGPFSSCGSAYFTAGFTQSGIPTLSVGTSSKVLFSYGVADFTFEFWYFAPKFTETYQYSNLAFDNGKWQTGLSGKTLYFDLDGTWKYFSIPDAGVEGKWTHIQITRSAGTLRGFVNGVLKTTLPGSTQSLTGTYAIINSNRDTTTTATDPVYYSNIRSIIGVAANTTNFVPATSPLAKVTGTELLLTFIPS